MFHATRNLMSANKNGINENVEHLKEQHENSTLMNDGDELNYSGFLWFVRNVLIFIGNEDRNSARDHTHDTFRFNHSTATEMHVTI